MHWIRRLRPRKEICGVAQRAVSDSLVLPNIQIPISDRSFCPALTRICNNIEPLGDANIALCLLASKLGSDTTDFAARDPNCCPAWLSCALLFCLRRFCICLRPSLPRVTLTRLLMLPNHSCLPYICISTATLSVYMLCASRPRTTPPILVMHHFSY